ncbi:mechanosensitive ion channel domain-containing protein [Ruminococcus sp. Marseille-P6503]|uniref:mechanosensitive ion channel family protein n=1 Tax=Ruminococcus sp. Marseille-P6503 TaxID=2364796 RepID=UPI000F5275DC|nr:mechanosensitive ion channel domain-containing protein [Ruminococcus sp. Marseille-P6503]
MGEHLLNKLKNFAPDFLSAVIILAVGILITKIVISLMTKTLKKSRIDPTAHAFLISLVKPLLYILVAIITLSKLNVPMTSIIATLSAAGLAIGLALQNSLSNVAGGFIIMFNHPFKCGDFVEINGESGTVSTITILYTRLLTTDNKAVLIPNGTVASATIINYTQEACRRLDMYFSIDYSADYRKASGIIQELLKNEPMALSEPEPPQVVMCEHSASAIKILARIWVRSEDYWALNYKLLMLVKDRFDEEGISIPYDQLDVHLTSAEESKS